eukprot:2476162-Prorocentrum_lima.AAC.1
MTSSLVGSEMCIRDSSKDSQHSTESGHQMRGTKAEVSQYHLGSLQDKLPVSYTHLTLPTICSV